MLSVVYTLFLKMNSAPVTNIVPVTVEEFTNTENVSVTIQSNNDQSAISFTGIGFVDLPLFATTTASGARFINDETELEVWNKANEVLISYRNDVVFTGSKQAKPTLDEFVTSGPLLSPAEILTSYTWQWYRNDPSQTLTEDYSITFNKDGTLKGTTTCGNFTGTFNAADDLVVNTIDITTSDTCLQESSTEAMDSKIFITALESTQSANITEGMDFVLYYGDTNDVLEFRMQLIEML